MRMAAPADRGYEARRLRDHIRPDVRVLFVGINPGVRSAMTGHHFAGHANRFWKLLHESGLLPSRISFEDDGRLPGWGYGITNLVARPSPGIDTLTPADYQAGKRRLLSKIRRHRPRVVALTGVTLYRALFRESLAPRREATGRRVSRGGGAGGGGRPSVVGLRPERIAGAQVFVLPNPSGRNAHYSYRDMLSAFRALRRHLDTLEP